MRPTSVQDQRGTDRSLAVPFPGVEQQAVVPAVAVEKWRQPAFPERLSMQCDGFAHMFLFPRTPVAGMRSFGEDRLPDLFCAKREDRPDNFSAKQETETTQRAGRSIFGPGG